MKLVDYILENSNYTLILYLTNGDRVEIQVEDIGEDFIRGTEVAREINDGKIEEVYYETIIPLQNVIRVAIPIAGE